MAIVFCQKCNVTPLVDFGPKDYSDGVLGERPICNSCIDYPTYLADTAGAAAALLDAEVPDRMCAWCLRRRSSDECSFGTNHRYQEHFGGADCG